MPLRYPPDVVVLGAIHNIYMAHSAHLPNLGQTVRAQQFDSGPGGKGANQAVAVARLGGRVALIGRVGADARGAALLTQLAEEGVNTRQVLQDPSASTGAVTVGIDQDGRKQVMLAAGANDQVCEKDVRAAARLITGARVLLTQLEVPLAAVSAALRLSKAAGVLTVLDPAGATHLPRDLLPLVDIMRPSTAAAEALTDVKVHDAASARHAANVLLAGGVRAVFIQAGDDGNLLVTPDETRWLAHLDVVCVDSNGAGDACTAALAMALAEEQSFADAAGWGHAAAALATTQMGAHAGLPRREAVQALLGI